MDQNSTICTTVYHATSLYGTLNVYKNQKLYIYSIYIWQMNTWMWSTRLYLGNEYANSFGMIHS